MAKYKRTAEWIWRERVLHGLNRQTAREALELELQAKVADEANRYLYFRKTFVVDGDIEQCSIDVSADGRYELYVNQVFVGRGPSRSNPAWQKYDTYDIAHLLHSGPNVIAALVHSYGRNCGWYELPRWEQATAFGCGGFFLQGTARDSRGNAVALDTNESWRYLVSQAWKRETVNGQVGFAEEYDARQAPKQWQSVTFDDTEWHQSQALRVPGKWGSNDVVPFPVMIPRDIPFLLEEEHWPQSIVAYGEVVNAPDQFSIAEIMQDEPLHELDQCSVTNLEAILEKNGHAEIVTTHDRSVSVVLDFGKTEAGRVRFHIEGSAGTIVDFCYTERLQDDGRVERTFWGDRHVYAHRVILDDGPTTWQMFDWGGFRYLQVTVRHATQPVRLHWVNVEFTSYPVGERGKFECNDELLNQAYQISAYTLQCCMLDSYEDCPSREQRQWTNDQYVQLMCNYAMFGDPYLARNLLVQVGQSQQEDGQVMQCAPGDLAVTQTFNMPAFTLHWIMSIPQYVLYTGDTAIIRELYHTVARGVDWFERHLDEDGLLNDVPGCLWIDWADIDKKGQMTELNARYVGCLRIVSAMANTLGYDHDAEDYARLADNVAASIRTHLWDSKRGVYVDSRRQGVQSRRVSQESSAAAMFFGIAPSQQWESSLRYITDLKRLVMTPMTSDHRGFEGPADFDEESKVVLQHAYYMHFLHAVWAKLGEGTAILQNIRRWWGPQIEAGTKTWWEAWEKAQHPTLCHAFSCTPGHDLATYVLGVKPLTNGFRRFRVAPLPGDLEWARGVFPSVSGDIAVSWTKDQRHFQLRVEVPEGTEAELVVPDAKGSAGCRVTLDGQVVEGSDHLVPAGEHNLECAYLS